MCQKQGEYISGHPRNCSSTVDTVIASEVVLKTKGIVTFSAIILFLEQWRIYDYAAEKKSKTNVFFLLIEVSVRGAVSEKKCWFIDFFSTGQVCLAE